MVKPWQPAAGTGFHRYLVEAAGDDGTGRPPGTYELCGPKINRNPERYAAQGLFEHTGNLWRAQGRRARLEFKHAAADVAFLVTDRRLPEFERAVDALGERWAGRVRLRLVGPLAPYDFVPPPPDQEGA